MKTFDEAAQEVLLDWKVSDGKKLEHHRDLMKMMQDNEIVMTLVQSLEINALQQLVQGKSLIPELATAFELGLMTGIEMEKQEVL